MYMYTRQTEQKRGSGPGRSFESEHGRSRWDQLGAEIVGNLEDSSNKTSNLQM